MFIHCIVFVFILSSQKKFREVDERPKAYLVAEFGRVGNYFSFFCLSAIGLGRSAASSPICSR